MRLDREQVTHRLDRFLHAIKPYQAGREVSKRDGEPRVLQQRALRGRHRVLIASRLKVGVGGSAPGDEPAARVTRAQALGARQELEGLVGISKRSLDPSGDRKRDG